jgi:hypothetical protein
LEILKTGRVVKTYTGTAGVRQYRSWWWEGQTATEMRRRGLLMVRDSIEGQMYQERGALDALLRGDD